MTYFDYTKEPKSDIAFVDIKSFYASVECVERGLHPLKTSLCVMSRADYTNGLILASSPMFKKVFGKTNVSRSYDLPFDVKTRRFNWEAARRQGLPLTDEYRRFIETWAKETWIVPPQMDLYIQKNIAIQHIFQDYASPEDILPYSIDEGFIDVTSSLSYFFPQADLSAKEKLDRLAQRLQRQIWREMGLYATVGMSNSNPLLAKLALDNDAKHRKKMRANWSYEDVPSKVWEIPELTDFWGIGYRMAKRLNQLGIYSVKDLAHSNPDKIKAKLGLIGVELFCHAHGIDESNVHQPYFPKSHSLGNSQILSRDYDNQADIELVLREMAEQVAIRLRQSGQKTRCVAIQVSYAKQEGKKSIQVQRRIDPSQNTKTLSHHVVDLFRSRYDKGAVRRIAVTYSDLVDERLQVISLFDDPKQIEKEDRLQHAIDTIRETYGFETLQRATVLQEASRALTRNRLIGGHAASDLGAHHGRSS